MNYKNSELKIDQFINYLNDDKINLSPVFQRGHVWNVGLRKSLLKNILLKRPIPAIFLYKEAEGSKYTYNILDGKQRLESIMLFVAAKRSDLKIKDFEEYFFSHLQKKQVNFCVEYDGTQVAIDTLHDTVLRDFREYSIPTIEITLDENSHLDDVISLFVDINQKGVPVRRFDIVKAMCKESKVLKKVYELIAIKQKRGKDDVDKVITNNITKILKKLKDVDKSAENRQKVDRMWEKLLEIVVFAATKKHRKQIELLNGFINLKSALISELCLTKQIIKDVQMVFSVLNEVAKKHPQVPTMFSEYTYFYSVITTILKCDLTKLYGDELPVKLQKFCILLDNPSIEDKVISKKIKSLRDVSSKHTTNILERTRRGDMISEILKLV